MLSEVLGKLSQLSQQDKLLLLPPTAMFQPAANKEPYDSPPPIEVTETGSGTGFRSQTGQNAITSSPLTSGDIDSLTVRHAPTILRGFWPGVGVGQRVPDQWFQPLHLDMFELQLAPLLF